jgi:hypothetical protein
MSWPPVLAELKSDMKVDAVDTRDDVALQLMLDASVFFAERMQPAYNYAADPMSDLDDPDPDLKLGAIRLASRWHTRRRSPDGLVAMAELGSARVPSFDPDIERLLRIGRYRGPVFA